MSKIEDAVAKKLQDRAAIGKNKYGVTMERTDLTDIDWLKHAQEEAMDLAVYLEKLIQRVENGNSDSASEWIDFLSEASNNPTGI
jgi:hypothetical protein